MTPTQVPPTTSRVTGNPVDEADDPGRCPVIIDSGEREGEVCERELPCPYHSGDD
jgi:hypothetical protein